MTDITGSRAVELLEAMPWREGERLRIVWIHVPFISRTEFADAIRSETVVPLAIREPLFQSANAVLSDINKLLGKNRNEFSNIPRSDQSKITVAILSKDEFRLPQIASPVQLPQWFPILGGREVFLRVEDIIQNALVDLLNCPEARVEQVSALMYELERELVTRAQASLDETPTKLDGLLSKLYEEKEARPLASDALKSFSSHLDSVLDARAYRVSARLGPSLLGRLVRLAVRSSPDQLATVAKVMSGCLGSVGPSLIKPSLLGVLLRPTIQLNLSEKNWHSVLVAIYQAYQLSTAAAHAGDYATYPVGLIDAASLDLARVLSLAVRALSTSRA